MIGLRGSQYCHYITHKEKDAKDKQNSQHLEELS